MLTKEYRIALPLTVEEYRIAQLYMISKKSREETRGAGSGVEILVNEPYTEGPGGTGQYTHKVYHVGSHLPGWFKALLPKSALTVEEEAWNAYPYTKTRYTCPFVEKFYLEIETKYFNDGGHQDNVFDLSPADLRSRVVDVIEVVKDQLYGADYVKEEDPRYFVSQKSGRGPLAENWIDEYWSACQGQDVPLPDGRAIMCAYKLCRVEFRYWGMQSKIEKFIHDVALRKTMLRAHRQAWAWQDEWCGLTMEDIRRLEKETQDLLAKKMMSANGSAVDVGSNSTVHLESAEEAVEDVQEYTKERVSGTHSCPQAENRLLSSEDDKRRRRTPMSSPKNSPKLSKPRDLRLNSDPRFGYQGSDADSRHKVWSRSSSRATLNSPGSSSNKSFDLQVANWRMESIVRDSDSSSDDEFFDCQGSDGLPTPVIRMEAASDDMTSLTKWNSLELIPGEEASSPAAPNSQEG